MLVVGDVVTDVVVHPGSRGPDSRPVPDSDTPSVIRFATGGAGANVASALARTRVAVRLAGRVGDDPWGAEHRRVLAARGVDVRLTTDPVAPSGTVVVIVDGQQRTMFPDRGANAALRPDDVLPAARGVGHVHLSGYLLLDERSRATGLAVLADARSNGRRTSTDASSVGPLRTVGPAAFLRWTEGVDVLHANADEAAVLAGTRDPQAAARTLGGLYGEVVVTCGGASAWWCDGRRLLRVPADRVEARDPTGAGDAFTGAFLAARIAGRRPEEALRAGHAAGAAAAARRTG